MKRLSQKTKAGTSGGNAISGARKGSSSTKKTTTDKRLSQKPKAGTSGGNTTSGQRNTKGSARKTNTNKGMGTNGNKVRTSNGTSNRTSKKRGRSLDAGEARMAEMLSKKKAKSGKTVNRGKIKKLAIKKAAAKRRTAGK